MTLVDALSGLLPVLLSIGSALICQWYKNCQTVRFILGKAGSNTETFDLFAADDKGSIVNMKYRFHFKGSPFLDPALLNNANIPSNVDPNGIIDPVGNYYTQCAAILLWVPKEEDTKEINLFNRNETGGNGDEQQFALYPILERVIDGRYFLLNGYSDDGYIFEGGFKNRTHPGDVIGDISKGDSIKLLILTSDNMLRPLNNYLNLGKVNQGRGMVSGTLTYAWLSDLSVKKSSPIITENMGSIDSI